MYVVTEDDIDTFAVRGGGVGGGVVWCGVVWCGVVWCGVGWGGVGWTGAEPCCPVRDVAALQGYVKAPKLLTEWGPEFCGWTVGPGAR
jgi:hypothetical protein